MDETMFLNRLATMKHKLLLFTVTAEFIGIYLILFIGVDFTRHCLIIKKKKEVKTTHQQIHL